MDWPKATARRDENHLSFRFWCILYQRFYGMCIFYGIYCKKSPRKPIHPHPANTIWRPACTYRHSSLAAQSWKPAVWLAQYIPHTHLQRPIVTDLQYTRATKDLPRPTVHTIVIKSSITLPGKFPLYPMHYNFTQQNLPGPAQCLQAMNDL